MNIKNIQIYILFCLGFSIVSLAPNQTFAQDEEEGNAVKITNIYADFDPISVHVIKDRRIRGILMVDFKLALQKAEDEDHIEKIKPRIRSAIIEALTRVANARVNVRKPLDVDLIATQIQNAVDGILGSEFAKVLIVVASTQPK